MLYFYKEIIFILFSVLLNVLAQYLIKYSLSMKEPITGNFIDIVKGLFNLVITPACFLGLSSAFLAAMFYILALNKLPLSIAYPMTALGFVAIVCVGFILFDEPVTLIKMTGLSLIIIGIGFILQP